MVAIVSGRRGLREAVICVALPITWLSIFSSAEPVLLLVSLTATLCAELSVGRDSSASVSPLDESVELSFESLLSCVVGDDDPEDLDAGFEGDDIGVDGDEEDEDEVADEIATEFLSASSDVGRLATTGGAPREEYLWRTVDEEIEDDDESSCSLLLWSAISKAGVHCHANGWSLSNCTSSGWPSEGVAGGREAPNRVFLMLRSATLNDEFKRVCISVGQKHIHIDEHKHKHNQNTAQHNSRA